VFNVDQPAAYDQTARPSLIDQSSDHLEGTRWVDPYLVLYFCFRPLLPFDEIDEVPASSNCLQSQLLTKVAPNQ